MLGVLGLDLVVGGHHILRHHLDGLQPGLQAQVVVVLNHLQVGHRVHCHLLLKNGFQFGTRFQVTYLHYIN